VEDAWDVDALSTDTVAKAVLPAALAVEALPQITFTDELFQRLLCGQLVEWADEVPAGETAAMDTSGRLLAIVGPVAGGRLKPLKVFPTGERP
jgi:hypothetical protein